MTACFVCEDYAAVCKLCKLPGTRCHHGRKFKPVNCPACTRIETPAIRVRTTAPKFSLWFRRLARWSVSAALRKWRQEGFLLIRFVVSPFPHAIDIYQTV